MPARRRSYRSDLRPHITSPGTLAYGRVDTAAALARSIDTLNRLSPRPDLVVISGDIANPALPEEYEHAKTLLGPAGNKQFAGVRATLAESLQDRAPRPSDPARVAPRRGIRRVWSPMVCQSANFLVLILMAMPIRRHRTYNGLF